MTVFANGLEVACKAQGNKVIANFPDVCFTPPENPATPPGVPVPYPSFGFDSDTDGGTSTVKIGGKTITQKNQSYYTKTSGTEAGCAAKKGVITSKNTGKEYAVAWSSNVKADGEPVNRMSDLSTNNHASPIGNAPPHPKVAKADLDEGEDPNCLIGEYDDIKTKCANAKPPGEAHHIVPDKAFRTGSRDQAETGATTISRTFGTKTKNVKERKKGAPSLGEGMCICLSKSQHEKVHKKERDELSKLGKSLKKGLTTAQKKATIEARKAEGTWGTADMGKIVQKSKDSLDAVEQDKNGNPTADCIKKARAAVNQQTRGIKGTGRTSGPLVSEAGVAKMLA
ncbi:DUF4150 domain-containing protein [Mesorhizobium sp.]|uniref:DUF4150 domain-containing protein n=1 Tax=Mesorhizobium sp. TaxID=1871066 RepID=UPI000FEA9AE6|nr:DUF4150 domain-containing protein [Mesorhizobium sp.]RWO43352.1 MAG: DUF4150 domain-containing protein [Mesorhizobium sp.]TIN28091.1 MAG: DUF4150 domain-containing protein [Mesorhizobium sp.]TIN33694.1 MAG: DUF4150 domain-containing protein [Mesorhizobium sp.]TJU76991.1 MAG: DUF4150 domain-containing protein [Mesorhizobium sp.]TJU84254.1 MAG: DUF4150 domain-containing protein [Mesorhizobium sp.]